MSLCDGLCILYVAKFSSLYSAALCECLSCGACIFLCPGPAHLVAARNYREKEWNTDCTPSIRVCLLN